jgi:acetyltransferase-like isoleucine patch superfamily enzyme
MLETLRVYVGRQASSPWRYCLESVVTTLFGHVPTVVGLGCRAVAYRLILHMEGAVGIESGVRLRFADNIRLGQGSYIDEGVYIHACPGGVEIGRDTYVMHHAELHVYNFRGIPHAGIRIGERSLIGEFNVLRGQGGITIGNRVYFAPLVQVLAVNHVFDDPSKPFIDQGITAEGVRIEDDVWIGAGAVITDGVTVACGAVVASGAVVTEDVAPHTVVGGVPARPLKEIRPEDARAGVAATKHVYFAPPGPRP